MNLTQKLHLLLLCGLIFVPVRFSFAQDAPAKVPAEDIRDLKLRDWEPRSMLKTKVTRINLPAFPVIDVHNHLGGGAKTLTAERVKRY
jgi:hypothetical protein